MTIRDRVREMNPNLVNEEFSGGVYGCPKDYGCLKGYNLIKNGYCPDGGCDACWSQEYRGDREQEKKFDASVVFIVLAVLEALWSIIAVVHGDSEWLRFCCVMGLLYIVAAGVWRTNQ